MDPEASEVEGLPGGGGSNLIVATATIRFSKIHLNKTEGLTFLGFLRRWFRSKCSFLKRPPLVVLLVASTLDISLVALPARRLRLVAF